MNRIIYLLIFVATIAFTTPVEAQEFETVFVPNPMVTTGVGGAVWRVYLDELGEVELDADGDGNVDRFAGQHTARNAAEKYLHSLGEPGLAWSGPGSPVYKHTLTGRTIQIPIVVVPDPDPDPTDDPYYAENEEAPEGAILVANGEDLSTVIGLAEDGAVIALERGGEWITSLHVPEPNVTITSYGTGPRPRVVSSEGWSSPAGGALRNLEIVSGAGESSATGIAIPATGDVTIDSVKLRDFHHGVTLLAGGFDKTDNTVILIPRNTDHTILTRVDVENVSGNGFWFDKADKISLNNCTAKGIDGHGIYFGYWCGIDIDVIDCDVSDVGGIALGTLGGVRVNRLQAVGMVMIGSDADGARTPYHGGSISYILNSQIYGVIKVSHSSDVDILSTTCYGPLIIDPSTGVAINNLTVKNSIFSNLGVAGAPLYPVINSLIEGCTFYADSRLPFAQFDTPPSKLKGYLTFKDNSWGGETGVFIYDGEQHTFDDFKSAFEAESDTNDANRPEAFPEPAPIVPL